MKVYLIDLKYSFVREDPAPNLNQPELVAGYIRDAFA